MLMLRVLMQGLLVVLLGACVREGGQSPLSTREGRETASNSYVQLGLGYLQEGETARAKVSLIKALKLTPRNSNAHAAMALVFQAEMEPELADEHFRRALSLRSDNRARILNNYGSFLYEQGRYKEAMRHFSKASEDVLYAGRARVFENMGMTALKLGQPEQAIEYFGRTLRLDPNQPQALLEMAELARLKREYSKARAYYEHFATLSAQTPRSLLLGVRLADLTGDRNKAKSLGLQLKKLYSATPEYQQYLSELP